MCMMQQELIDWEQSQNACALKTTANKRKKEIESVGVGVGEWDRAKFREQQRNYFLVFRGYFISLLKRRWRDREKRVADMGVEEN